MKPMLLENIVTTTNTSDSSISRLFRRPAFPLCRMLLVTLAAAACGFPQPPDVGPDGNDMPEQSPYRLIAIEPMIATSGDTILLEGTFAPTVTVNFPGGVSQPATVLGEHRATVVVPSMATAGALSVTTGAATVGALPFRRVSFELGLQTFQGFNDQAASARQESTLTTTRTGHTSIVIGSYLYVLGGSSGGSILQNIERARFHADGSLGAFTIADVSLVEPRANHTSVIVEGFLYVLGGTNGIEALASVERALINTDGSLGPFATVTGAALVTARKGATSLIVGNALYVMGGIGAGFLDSIERATINMDGSLSAFAVASGITLATARADHTTTIVGNAVYALGGANASGVSRTVERASISVDGSLDTFVPILDLNLVTARAGHTSIAIGRALYVLGGIGASSGLTSTEQATIRADGSLGPFAAVAASDLSTARDGHTAIVAGNFLYLVGGNSKSVERTSINAGGTLGAFAASGAILVVGNPICRSVVVGSWLYVFEGERVERAPISGDGSLGTFELASSTTLAAGRNSYTIAALGNRIYLLGGGTTEFGRPSNLVDSAVIATDGTIGPFAPAGVSLVDNHMSHQGAVMKDSIYVFGGNGPDSHIISIERALINLDDSLVSFTTTGMTTPPNIRATSAVIGNFVYIIGGDHSTSVTRAAINPDGSLGPLTTVSSTLVVGRDSHASAVIGNYLYVFGGIDSMGNYLSSSERAAINADGSLGPFGLVQGVLGSPRAMASTAVVGNTLYLIGGRRSSSEIVKTVESAILQ